MNPNNKNRWLRVLLWLIIIAIMGWVFVKIQKTVIIFILSFFFAYILEPVITYISKIKTPISKKELKRPFAIIIVYFIITFLLVIISATLIPMLFSQVNNLLTNLPDQQKIEDILGNIQDRYQSLPSYIRTNLENNIVNSADEIGAILKNVLQNLGNLLLNIISGTVNILTALIISLFILLSPVDRKKELLKNMPVLYRKDADDLLLNFHVIFGGFLKGAIIISTITGVFTLIGLQIMGFFTTPYNYSLIIGLISGIVCAIPFFGIIFSFVLSGVLAYLQTQNLIYALIVMGIVIGVNKIIDLFLYPKIMADTVQVSPVFTMFAAFAGGELFGVWGMLLGIPCAAMIKALFTYIHKKFLTEDSAQPALEENKI